MRAAIILPLLTLGLAGCQVSTDDANDSTTVQYNQELAENVAADVSNQAVAIGGHIANDVQEAGATVKNEVGDVEVDVDVSRNGTANAD
jgi:starvation-inducible outer membrane lipoprotein